MVTGVCSINHAHIYVISKLSYCTLSSFLYGGTVRILSGNRGFVLKMLLLLKYYLSLYCKLAIFLEIFAERGYPVAIEVSHKAVQNI